jgi:hypothetical protein
VRNGVLLRSDLHRLFDFGYVTVMPDLHLEVSSRLRSDFENGRTYYRCMGPRSSFPPQPLFALTLRCSAGTRNTSTKDDGKSPAGSLSRPEVGAIRPCCLENCRVYADYARRSCCTRLTGRVTSSSASQPRSILASRFRDLGLIRSRRPASGGGRTGPDRRTSHARCNAPSRALRVKRRSWAGLSRA